jgi:PAS domain S-box-containing protein
MKNHSAVSVAQKKSLNWYEVLVACDQVIIRSTCKDELFNQVCRHIVQLGEMSAAWIGTMDVGDNKVWPQAHFGDGLNYLEFIKTILATNASQGHGPVDTAVRENRALWLQDIQNDPSQVELHEWAKAHGWHSNAVLPLTTRGNPVGVLSIYAKSVNAFDVSAKKLLMQLASNVSYALDFFEHDEQRRLAEATLAESEVRYSALFSNSCMPMVLINPDNGQIVDANIRAVNYYGWDQATLMSMKIMDINALSQDEIRREMSLAACDGKAYFDCRHRLASGEVRDVEIFSSPLGFGGQTYLLSAIHDVTERRRVETHMSNMQVLIQQFLDELPGAAHLKDSELRLILVNKFFGDALRTDPSALIGKTVYDIFPKDFADAVTARDRQMLIDGGRLTVEETLNGRHLETNMFVMENTFGRRLLGGLTLDVTDRHRSAELTNVLLKINELGGQLTEKEFLTRGLEMAQTLTLSKIGFLHFVNDDQETLELVTWTAEVLQGNAAAYDSHYPANMAGIWADCLRKKAPVIFNDDASCPEKKGWPDGHATLSRLISVPVIESGQVRMLLGVGNKETGYSDADVDALNLIGNDLWRIARRARVEVVLRQQIEEQLALNQKLTNIQLQLLQSEKMASIGQLAAGVAHEINNPIGFVKSNLGTLAEYSQVLLKLVKDYSEVEQQLGEPFAARFEALRQTKMAADYDFMVSDLPQLITESREGVDRVGQIVLDLKGFSRASDNEWRWSDLQAGIESTINVVWNQLKYKVQIIRDYADLPQVFCVASQINQVVMNLLVNAEQAIAEFGHITIRTGVEGEQVYIEIQDDGCGMDESTQARIFEPFFTTKAIGLGTGLGLSIALGIVSRHQGKLELHSEPNVGSTFRLVLPINAKLPPNQTSVEGKHSEENNS